MAFYSARVDDEGNEIERRLATESSSSSNPANSARVSPNSVHSVESNCSSLSHLSSNRSSARSNLKISSSAGFSLNIGEESDRPSSSFNIHERLPSSAEYSLNIGDESDRPSARSDDSVFPPPVQPSEHSDIVPPLDLKSDDNYSTASREYGDYSYQKHCEATKIDLKPDMAYETWLSAKRKLLSDAAARRKKAEEQKKRAEEDRRRLAEENFRNWLRKKSDSESTEEKPIPKKPVKGTKSNSVKNNAASSAPTSSNKQLKPPLNEEEKRRLREEWEKKKLAEMEKRRKREKQLQEEQKRLKEEREKKASQAWKNWVSKADKKPKPVPLNRGILTLRGTISDIYVNPNKWQSIIPNNDEDD